MQCLSALIHNGICRKFVMSTPCIAPEQSSFPRIAVKIFVNLSVAVVLECGLKSTAAPRQPAARAEVAEGSRASHSSAHSASGRDVHGQPEYNLHHTITKNERAHAPGRLQSGISAAIHCNAAGDVRTCNFQGASALATSSWTQESQTEGKALLFNGCNKKCTSHLFPLRL